MRNMNLIFIVALLFLAACGGKTGATGACSDTGIVGTWDSTTSTDVITLDSSCRGTSSSCNASFTWELSDTEDEISLFITDTDVDYGNCMEAGEHTCEIAIDGDEFSVFCEHSYPNGGAPILTYLRRD